MFISVGKNTDSAVSIAQYIDMRPIVVLPQSLLLHVAHKFFHFKISSIFMPDFTSLSVSVISIYYPYLATIY